jgi:hypothetical protein
MGKYRAAIKLWVIYAILAFPCFYFVYKFGDPNYGTRDFFDYYKMYKDWDVAGTDAPFNMRLLSSFFVHLLYKAGFHYDTEIVFDRLPYAKEVFFSAIVFNFLCVVSTCVVIFHTLKKYFKGHLISFIGGSIYLFGFGTLFYELMPITDALSILMFAVVFHLYLERSLWILVPLALLILQREYIFMALGLVALLDYFKHKVKYYLWIMLSCIVCFAIYYVLRKTLFYTPKYDHQASASYFLSSILEIKFPLWPYLKQTAMTLNIFIIYMLVIVYKKYKRLPINGYELIKLLLLFLQINIISFAAVFGNNTGRYFYILIPMVIYYLILEVKSFKIE